MDDTNYAERIGTLTPEQIELLRPYHEQALRAQEAIRTLLRMAYPDREVASYDLGTRAVYGHRAHPGSAEERTPEVVPGTDAEGP